MQNSPTPRKNFSRYPLLFLSIYFAAGILLAKVLALGPASALGFGLVIAGMSSVRRRFATVLLPLLFLPLGILCLHIELNSVRSDRLRLIYSEGQVASYEPVEVEGVLIGQPEPAFGGTILTLRAERLSYKGILNTASGYARLFVVIGDEIAAAELQELDLRHGSRLRVMCRLEREERFRNPGGASRIEILDTQGIDAAATIKSPQLLEKIGDDPAFIPLAWLYERRQHLISQFRENLSTAAAGVMIASLLGDKHFLDRQTAEVFRDGGTFHVLVISGLHITFIGGVSLWLISLVTRRQTLQVLMSVAFLWAYTLSVGAEIPVLRASVMFTILVLSRLIDRTGSLLNAFGASVLLLLVFRPADLFSPSFQLTCVSVAAIVGCSAPLIEKLRSIGRWTPSAANPLPPDVGRTLRRLCETLYWNEAEWSIERSRHIWSANLFKKPYLRRFTGTTLQALSAYIVEGAIVSVIVQVCMLPLLVIYFHRVPPASVAMNLWVGFFIALESFSAVAAVLLNGLSKWLADPLFLLTEIFNTLMMSLPAFTSQTGLSGMRIPAYAGYPRFIYIALAVSVNVLAVALFRWDPFRRTSRGMTRILLTASLLTISLIFVIIAHPFSAPSGDGRLTVDFLDVGQGDSIFITFPDGTTMLVDGGGRAMFTDGNDDSEFTPDVSRIGEAVVSEFLWEKGYSRVDHLIATHADADHIQGLVDVARNFEIGTAMFGADATGISDFDELRSVLSRKGVEFRAVGRGDRWSIGGAEVVTYHPENSELRSDESANDASVVLLISFGNHRVLLTGDIERQGETDVLAYNLAEIDVVKVPHHGSRTSSTDKFVDAVRPKLAVISVGRRSRFGHPHAEVVDRWRRAGAEVMTTGERGTIRLISDGNVLEVQRFVP